MKPHVLLPFLSALALPLLAQEPAPPAPAPVQAKLPAVVVTLSFPGGSMAEFVAQLRAKESKANVVVAEAANGARLPPIELRGAGLDQALEGACAVAQSELDIRIREFRGAGEPVYSVVAVARQGAATTNPNSNRNRVRTHVCSLNHLTADAPDVGFPEAAILSSIEAATSAGGDGTTMRYHKESGVLVLRGTEEQISVAIQVIGCLQDDVNRRLSMNRRAPPPPPAAQPGKAAETR